MKFARPLCIAFGFVVVIIAVACLLARIPSIQRRLVLRLAAGRPGLMVKMDHVSAGFSSIAVDNLRIEKRGVGVSINHFETSYSLWSFLFRHRLSIRNLTATGLDVDVSHTSRNKVKAAVAGAPAATPGMLTEIKLPFELVLDDCQLSGRLLMPGSAGQSPLEAVFEIKGGKFSPGQEGSLRLNATVKNPAADADVGTLNVQLGLRAAQTMERSFSRVNVAAVVNAAGPSLSEQNQLKITSELTKGLSGENYSLSVDTLIHGTAENLLGLHAALPAGKNEYDGQWTIKARTAQLAPFFLGLGLPEFDARGEGRVDYAPATRATGLQGRLDASASRLEAINSAWKAIGLIKLQAQFDVTADGPVARLHRLDVRLAGENPVLEFSASQAAEIDFSDRRLHVGGVARGEALNLKLLGVPLAWLAPFVPAMEISGTPVTGEISITGETDKILLRAIRPLHVDQMTLATNNGTWLDKTSVSIGLDAVLTDRELKANISELTLQTASGDLFKSQVNATIPTEAHPSVSIQTTFTADLPTLLKPWLPNGHFKASGNADFSVSSGKIDVRMATATFTDASGIFLGKTTALHPFVFDPVTRMAEGEAKSLGNLAEIELGKIPLGWLPLNQPGYELGGTIEPTRLAFGVEGGKLLLRTAAPFKLSGVSLVRDGEPVLAGLDVEASPAFEIAAGSATVRTGDVSARNPEGVVVFSGKGETEQLSASGTTSNFTFNLEIPALAGQPYFAGTRSVSGGRASGEIRAIYSATRQIEARLTVNGLVAREGGQLLPVANLSFRAVVDEKGKISLQAPLLMDRAGQRSDLNLSIDLTPFGRTFLVDGKLTGDHVDLADAAAVLGVFSSGAARVSRQEIPSFSPPAPIVADKTSPWSRFTGGLMLDMKSATLGKDWAMTALTGTVAIDPASIVLKKLEASIGEKGQINSTAEIHFVSGVQPYQLTGDFKLTEFDAGKFFKAIAPARSPTVEGLFNISGHFAGAGETVDRTVMHTEGQFDLASRQGVFRGLQRTSGKLSMTTKAVEIGASMLGSLVGSEKATKAAEKVAGQAYFIDQFAQSLGELNYDQLNVRLVRDESLNFKMEDISLISPEIRLLGKGTVTYVAGKPLLEQPMAVSLSLAAHGKIEQLLAKLHLLDGSRDEVGYSRTKETITIGGSLAKPDPSAFFTRIATAKAADLLDSD